jgi:hypothetical protein
MTKRIIAATASKSKEAKRVNLTITSSNKEWIQKNKDYINVSALCQSAIYFAVARQEYRDAGDFISRLTLEKMGEPYSKGFEDAFQYIPQIPLKHLSAIEKKRLSVHPLEGRLSTHDFQDWWNHYYLMGWQAGLKMIWNKHIKPNL